MSRSRRTHRSKETRSGGRRTVPPFVDARSWAAGYQAGYNPNYGRGYNAREGTSFGYGYNPNFYPGYNQSSFPYDFNAQAQQAQEQQTSDNFGYDNGFNDCHFYPEAKETSTNPYTQSSPEVQQTLPPSSAENERPAIKNPRTLQTKSKSVIGMPKTPARSESKTTFGWISREEPTYSTITNKPVFLPNLRPSRSILKQKTPKAQDPDPGGQSSFVTSYSTVEDVERRIALSLESKKEAKISARKAMVVSKQLAVLSSSDSSESDSSSSSSSESSSDTDSSSSSYKRKKKKYKKHYAKKKKKKGKKKKKKKDKKFKYR